MKDMNMYAAKKVVVFKFYREINFVVKHFFKFECVSYYGEKV
jgi:hypothetical protein